MSCFLTLSLVLAITYLFHSHTLIGILFFVIALLFSFGLRLLSRIYLYEK